MVNLVAFLTPRWWSRLRVASPRLVGGVLIFTKAPAQRVADDLVTGRMRCPRCDGQLRLWGYARSRWIRDRTRLERIRPRRARCNACERTHVILPDRTLLRRLDRVEVIGAALTSSAAGRGYRPISRDLSLPATTVRDWIRRFIVRSTAPPDDTSENGLTDRSAALPFALADLVSADRSDDSFSSSSPGAIWRWASRESEGQLLR